MGVGPHGHSHEVTSRLSLERQKEEVDISCAFVDRVGGSRRWGYCYPFGAPSSFSRETEEAVAKAGCPFAFAVEAKDIVAPLARTDRYAVYPATIAMPFHMGRFPMREAMSRARSLRICNSEA